MTRDLAHWEAYYQGGAMVSCPMGRTDAYDREVREAWWTFFGALPDGARIVDVGTGNGAIPLIAVEVARSLGRRFEVHGVDLARIDPLAHVQGAAEALAEVVFHPQVAAEDLPFASDSVTAVASQFGIEYSDLRKSLREVARVLMPAGRAQFIAHHENSVTAENARATLDLGAGLFRAPGLFDLMRDYLGVERSDPARARELHAQLTQRSEELHRAAASASSPVLVTSTLSWLARFFDQRARLGHSQAMQLLGATEVASRQWHARVQDLLRAAWSPDQARHVCGMAREAGLQVVALEPQLHGGGNLVGWRLQLGKP